MKRRVDWRLARKVGLTHTVKHRPNMKLLKEATGYKKACIILFVVVNIEGPWNHIIE